MIGSYFHAMRPGAASPAPKQDAKRHLVVAPQGADRLETLSAAHHHVPSLSLPSPQQLRTAMALLPPLAPAMPTAQCGARALVQALHATPTREAAKRARLLDTLANLADTDSEGVREALRYRFGRPRHSLVEVYRVLQRSMGQDAAHALFADLFRLAWDMRCAGKDRIVIINATFNGGGVAELFQTCADILRHLRLDVEWHTTLASDDRFGEVGRKAFDVLQGNNQLFTDDELGVWAAENARLARILQGVATDPRVGGVFLEDHHPVHLIEHFQTMRRSAGMAEPLKLVWRSHVDNANLLAKAAAPMQLWEQVIKPQLQRLTVDDVALFQPGSVPDDVHGLACGVFTQSPGINPLAVKTERITAAQMEEILTRAAPGVRTDRPYLVTGGRYVGWKGLLPLMRAHRRLMQEFPDIDHLVFGTVGAGDPRKTAYFALVEAEVRDFERTYPEQAGRFQVVRDQSDDIRAFYAKAAYDQLPFCQMSVREGFGMMADEATCQGALPMTTLQGGLSRFGNEPSLAGVPVDIADLAAQMGDPADLYELGGDGRVVSRSPVAEALEERYVEHLRRWFTLRAEHPVAYADAYARAARTAHTMTLDACNVAMTSAYLSMCRANPTQLRDASLDRQPREVAAPSKRLVDHVRRRAFGPAV